MAGCRMGLHYVCWPLNVVKEAVAAKTLARSGGAACTDPTKKDGDSSGCFSPFQGKI